MRYSIKSNSYAMSIRAEHNVLSLKKSAMPVGQLAEGDELWVSPSDGLNVKANDKWLRVSTVNGNPMSGWIAVVHLGISYCTLTDNGAVEVPTGDPSSVVTVIKAVVHYIGEDGGEYTKELFPE